MNVTVIGIGNVLMTDDGVGVHIIKKLEKEYLFSESVSLIDGGTLGLDLLHFFEDSKRMLIIDAVDFQLRPGTIKVLSDNNIPSFSKTKLSVHHVGLPDLLSAARILGTIPQEVKLIGIQPLCIDMGYGLTSDLQDKTGEMITTVLTELTNWGINYFANVFNS